MQDAVPGRDRGRQRVGGQEAHAGIVRWRAVDPLLSRAARLAATRYGTPCYLYDLRRLDADAARLRAAFPDPWLRLYSLKANGLPALIGPARDGRLRCHGRLGGRARPRTARRLPARQRGARGDRQGPRGAAGGGDDGRRRRATAVGQPRVGGRGGGAGSHGGGCRAVIGSHRRAGAHQPGGPAGDPRRPRGGRGRHPSSASCPTSCRSSSRPVAGRRGRCAGGASICTSARSSARSTPGAPHCASASGC